MATLGEAVKLAAGAQRSASKPAAWMFGEVLAVSPLRILWDSRFDVGADQVVLMREFVAGDTYSGLSRTAEAILIAAGIALGAAVGLGIGQLL